MRFGIRLVVPLCVMLELSCMPAGDPYQTFPEGTPQTVFAACEAGNPGFSESDCDVKNCFSNTLLLHAMEKLLSDTAAALDSLKIKYWIDSGTLLGAVRFNSFLPWDDDIDVMTEAEDLEPQLEEFRKQVEARGYVLNHHFFDFIGAGDGLFGGKACFYQVTFTPVLLKQLYILVNPDLSFSQLERLLYAYELGDHLPHLDVFVTDRDGDTIQTRYKRQGPKRAPAFTRDMIFAADGTVGGSARILNKIYPAPIAAQIVPYLQKWYTTPDIIQDIVMNASLHSGRCTQQIRFKDVRQVPDLLRFFKRYLAFVFGTSFSGTFNPVLEAGL